jgi:hypothetical protein
VTSHRGYLEIDPLEGEGAKGPGGSVAVDSPKKHPKALLRIGPNEA